MPAKINKNNHKTRKTKNNKKTRKFQKGGAQGSASRKLPLPIAPRQLPITPKNKEIALINAVRKANDDDYNSAIAFLLKEYTYEALQTLQLSFRSKKTGATLKENEGQYKNRSTYYMILGYLYSQLLTESAKQINNHTYQNIVPIPPPRSHSTSISSRSSRSSGICSLNNSSKYEYCDINDINRLMKGSRGSQGSQALCDLNDSTTYEYCDSEYIDNLKKKLNTTYNMSNMSNILGEESVIV